MAFCVRDGSPDMYGLGIRMGFYLQWYSSILASWLAPSEIEGLRFTNSLFVASTFLALIISTANGTSNLHNVDIYITLLLTFGYYLVLVPLSVWRIVTAGNARLDPTRWPTVRPGALYNVLTSLLLLAVGAFQLWFWARRITPSSSEPGCPEYGFFFARIRLQARGFRVLNVVLYSLVLFACTALLLVFVAKEVGLLPRRQGPWTRYDTASRRVRASIDTPGVSEQRKKTLQQVQPLSNLIVASVVVLATELTIKWNSLRGVNTLSSAGQTIPFLVGGGSLVRVVYVYAKPTIGRRFGRDETAVLSSVPKPVLEPVPGPVSFAFMPVPYSAPAESIQLEPETAPYQVMVERPSVD